MGQEIYVFDSVLTTRISLSRDGYLDMLSIEAKNASSLLVMPQIFTKIFTPPYHSSFFHQIY